MEMVSAEHGLPKKMFRKGEEREAVALTCLEIHDLDQAKKDRRKMLTAEERVPRKWNYTL